MGRLDFGRPPTPPVAQHSHDDADAVYGDVVEGLQHKVPTKFESADRLGFR